PSQEPASNSASLGFRAHRLARSPVGRAGASVELRGADQQRARRVRRNQRGGRPQRRSELSAATSANGRRGLPAGLDPGRGTGGHDPNPYRQGRREPVGDREALRDDRRRDREGKPAVSKAHDIPRPEAICDPRTEITTGYDDNSYGKEG